ncbi:MAG TPA: type I phosphomannose isomerase catalytic subunit [Pirellulales bacterium]|nr:type I phosphomannose isomerase catalytic subunit [Pirellulales bacterium]
MRLQNRRQLASWLDMGAQARPTAPLYPLRFRPILRRYLWGGRRLGTHLGKPLAEGDDFAESWEVCDRGDDQSLVHAGSLAGTSLAELLATRGEEILGRHAPQPRFPLLFKFLDAQKTLSVQVHPDDARAARLAAPDLGKTEAWVVIEALPGSLIYAGLKRGFDRAALQRELARGTCELCLHRFEPRAGDCIFLPAGVVHAIGEGLLVAEIQQSSDVTYRLFDWNRLGPDGRPRVLHIEQALEAIDYAYGPAYPQTPQATDWPHIERLVACEQFVLDRWKLASPQHVSDDNRCHLLAVIDGEVLIEGEPEGTPLRRGATVLLPASLGHVEVRPVGTAVLLDAYLP